jgi:hypothetical protein
MSSPYGSREVIDERVVEPEHLHEWGARRVGPSSRTRVGVRPQLPVRADRVTTGNSVRIAAFGIRVQSGGHRKQIARLSRFGVAGSGAALRCLDAYPPVPPHHGWSYRSDVPRACSPAHQPHRGSGG